MIINVKRKFSIENNKIAIKNVIGKRKNMD